MKKLKEYAEEKKVEGDGGSSKSSSLLNAGLNLTGEIAKTIEKPVIEVVIVKPAPKEPNSAEFILNFPPMTMHDLNILKLTAHFVARNGRNFLAGLLQKEGRNFQFDFLKPHHSLFSFFTRLVEQYTKILIPAKETKKLLEMRVENPFLSLERISSLMEWSQYQESERKKVENEAEKERLAFASLDWDNFTVVETITFLPGDAFLDLPAPITLNELKTRSLVDKQSTDLHEKDKETLEEEAVEMDMGDETIKPNILTPSTEAHIVLSELSAPIKVRKDYVPKIYASQKKISEELHVCPNCNQSFPRDELANHLRIELLDPKWREQRQALLDKLKTDDVQAAVDVAGALKAMAKHRSDIFTEEEESLQQRLQKEDRIKRLEASLTSDDRLIPGFGTEFEPISYEPGIQVATTPNSSTPYTTVPFRGSFHPHPNGPSFYPPMMRPSHTGMTTAFGQGSYSTHQPSTPNLVMSNPSMNPENDMKRQRLDEESGLMPEEEFLSIHSGVITVLVQIPDMHDKMPKFTGQTLEISLDLTSTVALLKNELQTHLDIPISRQKLKLISSQLFLKDTNTLAYYNLTDQTELQLGLRERGGRK